MMNNIKGFIMALVMATVLIGGKGAVFAGPSDYREIPGVKVYIDGVEFETGESFYDFSNTTLVPMREFFEKLGANLEWDANIKKITATSKDTSVELIINSKIAKINGKDQTLSAEAKIINDQTYVPLRFVAEALMYEVDWNREFNIISIIDMKAINKKIKSKTYESSTSPKADTLKLEILDNQGIKVTGRTIKEKTDWTIRIQKEKGPDLIYEDRKTDSYHTYGDVFNLKDKLAEGKYKINIYLLEKGGDTNWGYDTNITLIYEKGEIYFPVSEVYSHNYLELMKNSVMDPKIYLKMATSNPAERNEIVTLANTIIKGASSDYEKLLKISDWVADNIYYNWDGYRVGAYGRTDAYGTLKNKKSVCQGYATLTQDLLRAVGIPARLVLGHALQANDWSDKDHSDINHAWNEAFVDGRWITIDTTWNSYNKYQDGKFTKGQSNYSNFDIGIGKLSESHKIISVEHR